MANLDYNLLKRVLERSTELATQTGANANVKAVYDDILVGPLTTYLNAQSALNTAIETHVKELKAVKDGLAALVQPYREARDMLVAYKPESVLPETLKVAPTDTDKFDAISDLLHKLDDNHTAPWAAGLLAGPFGTQAPALLQHLQAEIDDNKILSAARAARASAYGPAYDAFLRFKRVVRSAHGPTSKEYHRIHVRHTAHVADDATDGATAEGGATTAAASTTTTAMSPTTTKP